MEGKKQTNTDLEQQNLGGEVCHFKAFYYEFVMANTNILRKFYTTIKDKGLLNTPAPLQRSRR